MLPIRLALAAFILAAAAQHASAQTTMSPPPGSLGGKQPMSTTSSNTGPGDTETTWAPSLPAPMVDEDAPPAAFLDAARKAIATNATGEAQEALERAESRALDRAVKPSTAGQPSHQPLVQQISAARQALAAGDRAKSLSLIQAAIANPEANGKD